MGKGVVWYLKMYGEGCGVVLEDVWGRVWDDKVCVSLSVIVLRAQNVMMKDKHCL